MGERDRKPGLPGQTILGGSAAGLSYEGALRDALAKPDGDWTREARQQMPVRAPQAQKPAGTAPPMAQAQQQQQ